MRWQVLAPFAHTAEPGWIVAEAVMADHELAVVPAGYGHDRSRPATAARGWLDYMGHALRGWRVAGGGGVMTWFPQLAVCAGLIKRLTGSRRPVIAWCFNVGDLRGGLQRRLARFAMREVDCIVVHARREIPAYAEWLGLPRERFVFAPLAVAMPASAGPVTEEPFVLAMGSARRDYALFVAVMRELGLPATIVCGPHALEGVDIPDHVTVLRSLPIEACHDLARRARVNVTPIANDATASGQVTVIEAMMLGKAVAATRCIGTEDYIEDGVTGLLCAPGDKAALRCAIERLWHDAGLRRRLGENARRTAEGRFSFAAAGPILAAVVRATASGLSPIRPARDRPREGTGSTT